MNSATPNDPEWLAKAFASFDLQPPPSAELLELCVKDLERDLPADYLQFFTLANGGTGFSPGKRYMSLWPIDELEELNKNYEAAEHVPDMLLIGSDLGGQAYALDYSKDPPAYVEVPFIVLSRADASELGSTFREFMESKSEDEDEEEEDTAPEPPASDGPRTSWIQDRLNRLRKH